MISLEIDTPSWWRSQFNPEVNEIGLRYDFDLINEITDVAHIWNFSTKKRAARRYNSGNAKRNAGMQLGVKTSYCAYSARKTVAQLVKIVSTIWSI